MDVINIKKSNFFQLFSIILIIVAIQYSQQCDIIIKILFFLISETSLISNILM